jgi:class 3 adenylate cyclase
MLAALVAAPGLVLAQTEPPPAGPPASGMMRGADGVAHMPPVSHARARPLYRERIVHLLLFGGVATFVIHRLVRRRRRRGIPSAELVAEAVLVVDLVGSTRLATHHGDAIAMRARLELRDRARDEAERRGLVFTERTGDGRVMTFRSVKDAIDTVRSLVASLAATERGPGPALAVHAAITYGELLVDARRGRHGMVLNKAFRLDALTEEHLVHVEGDVQTPRLPAENRVLLDEEAAQEAERAGVPVRALGFCRLKGFSGLHRVYAFAETAPPRELEAALDRMSATAEKAGHG